MKIRRLFRIGNGNDVGRSFFLLLEYIGIYFLILNNMLYEIIIN